MRAPFVKGVVFISKSLLWSVMLYTVCMLTINWNEVHINFKGIEPLPVVQGVQPILQPVATITLDNPTPQTHLPANKPLVTNTAVILLTLYKVTSVFAQ